MYLYQIPHCRVVHATLVAELGPCGAFVTFNQRRVFHDAVDLEGAQSRVREGGGGKGHSCQIVTDEIILV